MIKGYKIKKKPNVARYYGGGDGGDGAESRSVAVSPPL